MTTAILTLGRVQKNLRAKINSIDLPTINWRVVCVIGFFITLALLIFYVWQINSLTNGAYLINNYEKQISKLSEENKSLQIFFAESNFWSQTLEKIHALNFQKTTSVKYIQIPENILAKK